MLTNIRVAWFLAYRQLRRANVFTTGLIIAIMTLTFLNLVVTSGILVGLIVGINREFQERLNGDLTISKLDTNREIERTSDFVAILENDPNVKIFSARYIRGVDLEAGYKTRKEADEANKIGAPLVGINPTREDAFGGLSGKMIEGRFLQAGDSDAIVLGKDLVQKYQVDANRGSLKNVATGDRIRMIVAGNTREYTIVGIVQAKADVISGRAYVTESEFRNVTNANNTNADEIGIKTITPEAALTLQRTLKNAGLGEYAKIQTFDEGLPKFVRDIANLFGTLGNFFGLIGIVVAAITLYILVYVNAVTKRKFIGILKGIGISERSIELSYVMQALFYAGTGTLLGLAVVYGFLVPFFLQNPINFPFSDGILVAPLGETLFRAGILSTFCVLAGFIASWMIVRQNTLNAILGR